MGKQAFIVTRRKIIMIENELKALATKSIQDLKTIYCQYFNDRPLAWNKDYLVNEIGYRMQELALGGLDTDTKEYLKRIKTNESTMAQKPTLPVGSSIMKYYKGKKYIIKVRGKGYELEGEIFNSLSGVARHITGMRISGYLFFDLEKRKKYDRTKEN